LGERIEIKAKENLEKAGENRKNVQYRKTPLTTLSNPFKNTEINSNQSLEFTPKPSSYEKSILEYVNRSTFILS